MGSVLRGLNGNCCKHSRQDRRNFGWELSGIGCLVPRFESSARLRAPCFRPRPSILTYWYLVGK